MVKKILLVLGALAVLAVGYVAYVMLTTRNHSPAAVAEYKSGDVLIQVNYCQPYKKGRLIFGTEEQEALVPFSKPWRTGANEATEISFSHDVLMNNRLLKAGRYSLYTIPDATSWTVVFNSKLGYWGAKLGHSPFEENLDVMRVPASVQMDVPESEQFTITLTPADSIVNLHFHWDKTMATVPMTPVIK
jgi:hypothetical protein